MSCERLNQFLDGALSELERVRFSDHMANCATCAAAVRSYARVQEDLLGWARVQIGDAPEGFAATRLVARAREIEGARRPRRWLAGLTLGGSLVFALAVAATVLRRSDEPIHVTINEGDVVRELDGEAARAVELEPLRPIVVITDKTRLGIAASTHAKLTIRGAGHSEVALSRGTIAIAVESHQGQKVRVAAGSWSVEVVGTRFAVATSGSDDVWLAVAEGKVVLRRPGTADRQVSAGEVVSGTSGELRREALSTENVRAIGELLQPSATPVPAEPSPMPSPEAPSAEADTVEHSRATPHKVDKKRDEACPMNLGQLETETRQRPRDVATWSRFASCTRKAGRFSDAVQAYRRAASLGGAAGNNARYMAALVSQEELGAHTEAAALLREFLSHAAATDQLVPSANVRLARSLMAVGERAEAQRVLQSVIDRFPLSAAAGDAHRLLEQLR